MGYFPKVLREICRSVRIEQSQSSDHWSHDQDNTVRPTQFSNCNIPTSHSGIPPQLQFASQKSSLFALANNVLRERRKCATRISIGPLDRHLVVMRIDVKHHPSQNDWDFGQTKALMLWLPAAQESLTLIWKCQDLSDSECTNEYQGNLVTLLLQHQKRPLTKEWQLQ